MIPVVSNVNMLPEMVGDSGYVLNKRNIDNLAQLMKEAIKDQNKEERSLKASARIKDNYSLKRREEELLKLLK